MLVKNLLSSFQNSLRASETVTGIVFSVIVGLAAGLGAVLFRWLIISFQSFFFEGGGQLLSFLGDYYVILIPAVGGLLVGPLVYIFAREARGHGVPEVMEAVAMRGGRIRPRVAVIKALASSLCIGSGGSVGREGPIVQIGSSFGSSMGQWFKLSDDTVRVLVACGSAGAIAATFNAPIAGVFFALEVILGRVVTRRFAYVVISAVVADFIAQGFLGNVRAFDIPSFTIVSPWEFIFYILLGILAAFTAVVFTRILYWTEDRFDSLKIPEYLKPAVGGLVIGAIGLYSHDLFGVGYGGIASALTGNLGLWMLLSLFVMKILATSITLGSGGSGGIFAPSLFIGAMLGVAMGSVFGTFFPDIVAPAGAYGIAGMAAVFAGAAHAPFSAILIIFEMTGDYGMILPLMTSVVVSTVVSRAIKHESIYTLKLLRRGVDVEQEEIADVMRTVTVKEAMTKDFPTLSLDTKIDAMIRLFQQTGHHGFPVVDENGMLFGVVNQTDLEHHLGEAIINKKLTAGDIATQHPFVAYPNQSLARLLDNIDEAEARIPVVSREDGRRFLGVLGRHEIIGIYRKKTRRIVRVKK